ncbi:hypothetical protein D9611_009375 [Ephemerocybe angulata]|uniref:NYN domain-containing protein n=1 Tax=Ephemerocybe angulata TaxID=980116 RepID=A0A8H5BGX0_9AGAR|nr:hypothetical protein D9611_009375 [Tulosesus angulatus]
MSGPHRKSVFIYWDFEDYAVDYEQYDDEDISEILGQVIKHVKAHSNECGRIRHFHVYVPAQTFLDMERSGHLEAVFDKHNVQLRSLPYGVSGKKAIDHAWIMVDKQIWVSPSVKRPPVNTIAFVSSRRDFSALRTKILSSGFKFLSLTAIGNAVTTWDFSEPEMPWPLQVYLQKAASRRLAQSRMRTEAESGEDDSSGLEGEGESDEDGSSSSDLGGESDENSSSDSEGEESDEDGSSSDSEEGTMDSSSLRPAGSEVESDSHPSSASTVSVFWDYDNCALSKKELEKDGGASIIEPVKTFVRRFGILDHFCAYHSTAQGVPPRHLRTNLRNLGVLLRCIPHSGFKDSVDHHIMVDVAYAIRRRPSMKTVVIISNDRDFAVLIPRILWDGLDVVRIPRMQLRPGEKGSALVNFASECVWPQEFYESSEDSESDSSCSTSLGYDSDHSSSNSGPKQSSLSSDGDDASSGSYDMHTTVRSVSSWAASKRGTPDSEDEHWSDDAIEFRSRKKTRRS